VAVRSQFDCSVPLQVLAVEIMFFDAYYVAFFICEGGEESERFYETK